jgi:hypothetical protein
VRFPADTVQNKAFPSKTKNMNPTLQDLYQFLIKMHGNEEAAKADFDCFMAGKLPEHLIEYCRQAAAAESPQPPRMSDRESRPRSQEAERERNRGATPAWLEAK